MHINRYFYVFSPIKMGKIAFFPLCVEKSRFMPKDTMGTLAG
jgi:hypothetical protein